MFQRLSSQEEPNRMYVVIACYNCGQFLLAKIGQKTKRCPYCETRLVLEKAKKVGSVENAQQALDLVQALKRARAFNRESMD